MVEKKVAWITGSGAPRVGQVIAKFFAAKGFRIVLHANSSMESASDCALQLQRSGTEAFVLRGAVEDPDFAKASVQQIVRRFGRLDVLVNSAAVWDGQLLEDTTVNDLKRQYEVNTLGTFLCCQAAGLQMVSQSTGGAIVLIGDWSVIRPYPGFAAYFAGKGAIETMTRSFAVELATRNPAVRVNAILPGPVMLAESISRENADTIRAASLLKIHGQPEHVAEAAYFLASHEFITGVCLPVDGGRSIYAGHSADVLAHPEFEQGMNPML